METRSRGNAGSAAGRAHRTAGELAFGANVSAQSASGHLAKLVDGGLLAVRSSGRHRYFSLAGPEVAHALEALGVIATTKPAIHAIRPGANAEMYAARTCYDHLAGRIAVESRGKMEEEARSGPVASATMSWDDAAKSTSRSLGLMWIGCAVCGAPLPASVWIGRNGVPTLRARSARRFVRALWRRDGLCQGETPGRFESLIMARRSSGSGSA